MTSTDDLLAEVAKLDGAATKGPWESWVGRGVEAQRVSGDGELCHVTLAGGAIGTEGESIACTGPAGDQSSCLDALFIARSRTLIPELAATIREQAERIAELEVTVAATVDVLDSLTECHAGIAEAVAKEARKVAADRAQGSNGHLISEGSILAAEMIAKHVRAMTHQLKNEAALRLARGREGK